MSFIDKARLFVTAGNGGDGCLSFLREKYMEFGGPDGADGGKGGDVYLEANSHFTTLLDLSRHPHVRGHNGSAGKGGDKTGEAGADLVLPVPVGTVVYKDGAMVADLSRAGERYLAAAGGRGGRGNLSFKNRFNTAPRMCEKGAPGGTATLELELKLLADVGFVGFPNAGKSSLLARISAARPKVADYPFTTLSPNLGVAEHKGVSFVAADIPGLIEGAKDGKGLGTDFLKHVERTRVLVHLVDPLGFGGADPVEGVRVIEGELKGFSPRLSGKERILVVNKLDLPEGKDVLKKIKGKYRSRRPLGISAATGEGLNALMDRIIETLSRRKGPETYEEEAALMREKQVKVERGFRVENLGGGSFKLSGDYVERAAAMLDPSLPEAVDRFQRTLKTIGVDKALRRAGIQDGDDVRVGSFQFDWSDAPYRPLPRLRRAHKRTRIGVGGRRKK